jgi:hypothetical protein
MGITLLMWIEANTRDGLGQGGMLDARAVWGDVPR